jgi:4-aminobutyrate aminotransferase-like enzyme/Ser/Thr protein kinase RdoA (MazF antagonist)
VSKSTTNRPYVEADQLLELVAEQYGIHAVDLEPLAGEYNETWSLTGREGDHYVAKVLHDPQSLEHRLMQADLMSHLAESEPDLPIPRLIATLHGETVASYTSGTSSFHVQLLTWLPGRLISEISHRDAELLHEIGNIAGRLVRAGEGYHHPAAVRSHLWDLRKADEQVLNHIDCITEGEYRDIAVKVVDWFRRDVTPQIGSLPTGVVHQDLNDFNMLVRMGEDVRWHLSGILDFGDALETVCVAEVAIAVAYAMLGQPIPLRAAQHVVEGFHQVRALSEKEVACILPLAAARLAVNATVWTSRLADDEANGYAASRMVKTWPLLEKLVTLDHHFALAALREACRMEPFTENAEFVTLVESGFHSRAPLVAGQRTLNFLEPDEGLPDNDAVIFVRTQFSPDPDFSARRETKAGEPSTLTLGTHFIARAPIAASATHDGTILRADPSGGRILMACRATDQITFYAQYSGLGDLFVEVGNVVKAGQDLGTATLGINQIARLVVTWSRDQPETWLPDRVRPHDASIWAQRCPSPTGFLEPPDTGVLDTPEIVTSLRHTFLATSQRAYYSEPMNLTSARGVWFRDNYGRDYLDAINNVTHVGHSHPHVVEAATRQLRRLNTNSRFTYSALPRYADRLTSTLPDPLKVVFFTCTGSEANDLALRIARQVTGRDHVVVVEGAYHGNTTAVMGISPNRYRGAGGTGPPPTTHEIPQPNLYRGAYGYDHPDPGAAYARDSVEIIKSMVSGGTPPGAVFVESLMGTAGQVPLPPGYLSGVFSAVREVGGLAISDEVQVGLGRLGNTFWGFEGHGVIPDIVTMGKPLGNGYPLAALVTTREIADAFDNGMKYFNTFAGSPVACAIGEAVLDVIEHENLQQHVESVGYYFKERLIELASAFDAIGDVRGYGLYLGVELVTDRSIKTPARTLAYRVSERMKDEGVITYPNGDLDNVLKIKPPMIFTNADADIFVGTLAGILEELS